MESLVVLVILALLQQELP